MGIYQQFGFAMFVFWVGGVVVAGFVVYLFYARLRDIADELRKFRVAYEFAQARESQRQGHGRPEPAEAGTSRLHAS